MGDEPAKPDEEKEKQRKEEIPPLGFKDFLALSLAALETFLLPLIVIAIVVGIFALYFAFKP